MTWTVRIDGIPPTPNRSRRQFWAANAHVAAGWRRRAKEAAQETIDEHGGAIPHLENVHLTIWVCTRTRVRRDPDNAVAACKPLVDGIVDAGILRDDSFDVVHELSVRRILAPQGRAHIEIDVEEVA